MTDMAKAAQHTLERTWLSPSLWREYVKPEFRSLILRARVNLSENRQSFLGFLRELVQYGQTVVMNCRAFLPYSSFSRSRTSRDLLNDAASLGTEGIEGLIEDFAKATIETRGVFM
jgi:hypothetical protein